MKLDHRYRRLAVVYGAAAGIAATFQAPMAGTLFAVEILLFDLEVASLSNIVIAAVTGTMTSKALLETTIYFSCTASRLFILRNFSSTFCKERNNLETAFHLFAKHHISSMPVVDSFAPLKVKGIIKKTDLLNTYDDQVLKAGVL